jgi:hypothetical protein
MDLEDIHSVFGKCLPKRWIICHRCEGEGTVDHPAFSNGITSSEWAEWDDDERQDYMRGVYDVPCPECRGAGKVKDYDEDGLDSFQRTRLNRIRRIDAYFRNLRAEMDAMEAAERRFGA